MALVKFICIALPLVVICMSGSLAHAQHSHGDEHGKPVEFKMPTTYIGAVREVLLRLHEIEELIESRNLDQVHAQADVIRKVGDVIGQLALKPDSGVPRQAVKEVNKAGRELAEKFDDIDKVADAGDAAATRRVHAEMRKLAETLRKHARKEYACPMRCEGDKTYREPGKCPQCGMKLQDALSHMDHTAKHGGVFFMTSDQMHHLEGTISDQREFRVWLYDEYTRPIPADKFTGEGTAWEKNADVRKPFKLSVGPDQAFLASRIDQSIKFPISAKIYIDFKDGQKPQVFDFEFEKASEDPAVNKPGEPSQTKQTDKNQKIKDRSN